MPQLLHNHQHQHHNNTYNNSLRVMTSEVDHPIFLINTEMYNNDLHYDMVDASFVPYHNVPQRIAQEQPFATEFDTDQLYHDAPGYLQGSPSLRPYHAATPDLHNGHFHSSLSSASGQSASSSNVGSPYSNHATIAPPATPWPAQGLGIQHPTIANDDFGYQYSFGGSSGMDQQEFNFAVEQKPNGFVGECANISASWSSSQPSMSTSNSSMGPLVAQHNAINLVTTSAIQQIGNQGTRLLPMSPPVVRRVSRPSFPITSDSSRASHEDTGFSPGSHRNSSQSADSQRAGPSVPKSALSSAALFKFPAPASPFFSQSSGHFLPPFTCPDPSILQPYTISSPVQQDLPHSIYPPPQSPAPSDMSSERSLKRIKSSQSPYPENQSTFPYAYNTAPTRISMSPSSPGSSSSHPKNTCPFPDCGKAFKDLKAHMLTHQLERPEKCPIATCDYHTKGFARKYDKNRHTLTHYKGTMVCGFCPGSGSSAEKSFNRADVFKRHLTSVHYVEQVPPNARRKSSNGSSSSTSPTKGADFAENTTGKCSTCSAMFKNAQDFYEHLDDCVLRLVQQEEPSEAINAHRLAEVEEDKDVHDTLRNNNLSTTTSKRTSFSDDEDEEPQEQDDVNDADYSAGRKLKKSKISKKNGTMPAKGGRKKRKEYPSSWGCPQEQMTMKKRSLRVYDGQTRMWKEDMMMSSEYEVRIPTGRLNERTGAQGYVTDLDVATLQRAEDNKTWHQ